MTPIEAVLAELDRIAQLPVVQDDGDNPDSFAVGARWTMRMVRKAIERRAPAPPVGRDRPALTVVPEEAS
ncbi:hypothetical protein ACWDBD_03760 [Streptomyces sp. NPDC001118]